MSDDLAQAAAKIAELQRQLADEQARADSLSQQLEAERGQLTAAQEQIATIPTLTARVAELERLLAPPATDAGVLTINYSDGRVKYASRDGNKYPMAGDALHRNKVLGLMAIGVGEAQAETLLGHGDDILRELLRSPPA